MEGGGRESKTRILSVVGEKGGRDGEGRRGR